MMTPSQQREQATLADPRWRAVLDRDPSQDGTFFYAVTTTRVYCRPSCAARHARPENVLFFDSAQAARAAGFRACRRCRPEGPSLREQQRELVEKLCKTIESADSVPPLETLAAAAGMSRYHLHRVFKAVTGLTPRGYALAKRGERVRASLVQDQSITAAIYAAGYNSNGRFYEESGRLLGMTPSEYRARGAKRRIRFAVGQGRLGAVLVGASDVGVCAVLLGDDAAVLVADFQERFAEAELVGADPDFEGLVARVVGAIDGADDRWDLPLDIQGTVFQRRVWQALQEIPAGQTRSYGDIARRLGQPGAARAVARACAENSLAVAIPCHRVVRADGAIAGYRWGIERKEALLDAERARADGAGPTVEGGRAARGRAARAG